MTRTIDQLVQQEVIYCVSHLISELGKTFDGSDLSERIFEICIKDDWETAARESVDWSENREDGSTDWDESDWRNFCEDHDIEPYQIEAYEHWIVSEWLADKLLSYGEMVSKDIHGLTVWGRTTTGQLIAMDWVIEKIYSDLQES